MRLREIRIEFQRRLKRVPRLLVHSHLAIVRAQRIVQHGQIRRLLLPGLQPQVCQLQRFRQLLGLLGDLLGRVLLGRIGRLKPPEREVELCVGEVGDHPTTDEQAKGDRTDQDRPPDLSWFRCDHAAFGQAGLGQAVFDHAVVGHSSFVPSFSSFFSSCFSSCFRVPVPVTPTDSTPEMIVGVRKKMSSVFALRSSLDRKRAPRKGMSPKTGSFFSAPIFSSFMSPAMTRVVPSLTITVVSALEVSTMGILLPAAVVRERLTELTSGLIFMLTKPSSLMVGSTLSWRPTSMNVTCSAVVEALVVWVTAEVT